MPLILCNIDKNVGTYPGYVDIKVLPLSYKLDVGHTWGASIRYDSYVDN